MEGAPADGIRSRLPGPLRDMPAAAWAALTVGLLLALMVALVVAVLPNSLDEVGSYDTSGAASGYAYGVAVSGDYAYVVDSSGGRVVLDVSDPMNPTWTGSYHTGYARGVAVSGVYA